MAINDWSAIQSLFDKLNKQLEKSQKVADQAVLPRVYIRLLVELEVCSLDCKLSLAATSACLLHCLQVCMCCERQVHAQPCCRASLCRSKALPAQWLASQHALPVASLYTAFWHAALPLPNRLLSNALGPMQDFLLKTLGNREAKKKMSSTNAKALNTMRQRLKKHNTQFQEQIDAFREHPESSEEESADSDLDEDASDSTDSDESVAGDACSG